MQVELNLTPDELAEAARLLRFKRTGTACTPGFEEFEDAFWKEEVQRFIEVLSCLVTVVDNRKEKEIG